MSCNDAENDSDNKDVTRRSNRARRVDYRKILEALSESENSSSSESSSSKSEVDENDICKFCKRKDPPKAVRSSKKECRLDILWTL